MKLTTSILVGMALVVASGFAVSEAGAQVVCQKLKSNGSAKYKLRDACRTDKGEVSVVVPPVYTVSASAMSDGICTPVNLDAFCEAGDVLLGGGCAGTADQWYFRVNTRRADEGWTCRAVRNAANGCVVNDVTAKAICSDLTP